MQLLARLTDQDGSKIKDSAIIEWVNNKVSKKFCNILDNIGHFIIIGFKLNALFIGSPFSSLYQDSS